VKQLGISDSADESVKWYNHFKKKVQQFSYSRSSQSAIQKLKTSTLPGDLWEMQTLITHPRCTESKTLETGTATMENSMEVPLKKLK